MKALVRTLLTVCFLIGATVGVRADFNPDNPPEPMVQYAVSISADPAEATSSISLGGAFSQGKVLSISVSPASGYRFLHWTLNGVQYTTSASFSYTVGDSAVSFVAHLAKNPVLSVSVSPAEAGTAYGGGAYAPGSNRRIYTNGNTGYTFLHWTLNGEKYTEQTSFYYTVGEEDAVFVAVYQKDNVDPPVNPDDPFDPSNPAEPEVFYYLQVSTDLPAGVTPSSITPNGYYAPGKYVSLSTTVPEGYTFLHWTLNDVLYSDQRTCPYTMGDSAAVFVAHFATKQRITLSVSPEEAGTVSGAGLYVPNTKVLVTTTPNEGYTFLCWKRNDEVYAETSSFYYIVSTVDVAFEAVYVKAGEEPEPEPDPDEPFVPANPPEPEADKVALHISVGVNDPTLGSVSGLPETPLFVGDLITLTATSADPEHYYFLHWADGNTSNPRDITLTVDAKYVAVFAKQKYLITFYDEDSVTVLDQRKWNYGDVPSCVSPAKADDANYSYRFDKWQPDIAPVSQDTSYYATYEATKLPSSQSYTITWLNEDGSQIDQTTVEYGVVPTHADPTKQSTAEYTYTFSGWTPEVVAVTADATYKATFTAKKNSYTITWLNEDGSLIDKTTVEYGVVPTHADPTKQATAEYTYTFAGWTPEVVAVTADATYQATFTATKNSYTITWLNEDGSQIDKTTVEYGVVPTHADPTKQSTAEYTYTFSGWTPEVVAVTSDATYQATFTAKKNSYIITWLNEDGSQIDQTTVEYGVVPTHADPTKQATAEYTYTFAGWTPEVVAVTADATYQATFTATKNSYTITWLNEDGSQIDKTTVEYGVVPTHADPTKQATAEYTYTFAGWTPEVVAVTSDATYKATFTAKKNSYTITWLNEDGSQIDQTTVEYGVVPTHADPTKQSTAEYTYTFSGWTPEVVAVTSDATYQATFTATKNSYTVTAIAVNGAVEGVGEYEYGTEVSLKAVPNDGYHFDKWGDGVTDNPRTVTVTSDIEVTALFEVDEQPDYIPQNLKAEVEPVGDDDTQITLSWDKVDGVANYELQLMLGEQELYAGNTFGLNVIVLKLSDIQKVVTIDPGVYTIDWKVRSTDTSSEPLSDWAQGTAFTISVVGGSEDLTDLNGQEGPATRKVLINGCFYILTGDHVFTIQGMLVN